jgi:aspartyl protease family protein
VRLRSRPSARLFGYAAFWLLSAGLAYVAFDAIVSPKVASAVADSGSGVVVIDRSYDQHFYVAGAINGHPVTFMVDTGASVVSVSADLARKLGLPAGAPAVFETFGGRISGRMVPDVTVEAGGIRVEGIRVGVGNTGRQALLGQNFLNKVDLTQTAERMTLRVRSAN